MSKQVKRRRGTTAEHATFTGAVGEITVDTTRNALVAHDGSTSGGFPARPESEGILKVDSISDLTALSKPTYSNYTIIVAGYTSAGDGGGGVFYWDSSSTDTADGGTIFSSDAGGTGRWKRIYDSFVNAKWFGATGDGVTDDTSAIQTALDISDTQAVFLPEGNYSVSQLLVNPQQPLFGTGASTVITASDATKPTIVYASANSLISANGYVSQNISDIKMVGPNDVASGQTSIAIAVGGTADTGNATGNWNILGRMHNVQIEQFYIAIKTGNNIQGPCVFDHGSIRLCYYGLKSATTTNGGEFLFSQSELLYNYQDINATTPDASVGAITLSHCYLAGALQNAIAFTLPRIEYSVNKRLTAISTVFEETPFYPSMFVKNSGGSILDLNSCTFAGGYNAAAGGGTGPSYYVESTLGHTFVSNAKIVYLGSADYTNFINIIKNTTPSAGTYDVEAAVYETTAFSKSLVTIEGTETSQVRNVKTNVSSSQDARYPSYKNGNPVVNINTTTALDSVTHNDTTIHTDGATGTVTLTMPNAVVGARMKIVNAEAQTVTLAPATGSQQFRGFSLGTSISNTGPNASIELFCTQTNVWEHSDYGTWA